MQNIENHSVTKTFDFLPSMLRSVLCFMQFLHFDTIISYWSKLFSPVFVLVFTVIEINWMLKILGFFDYSCTSNYIGISLFTLKQRVSVCSISCSFSVSAPFSIRQIIRLNWNTIAAMITKREKCKCKICWWPIYNMYIWFHKPFIRSHFVSFFLSLSFTSLYLVYDARVWEYAKTILQINESITGN